MSIKKSIKQAADSLPRPEIRYGSEVEAELRQRLQLVTQKGDHLIEVNRVTEDNTVLVAKGEVRAAVAFYKQAKKQRKLQLTAAKNAKKRMIKFVKDENARLRTFAAVEDGGERYQAEKEASDIKVYSLIKEVFTDLHPFGMTDVCRRIMDLEPTDSPEKYQRTVQSGLRELIQMHSDVFRTVSQKRSWFEALKQKWLTEFRGQNAPELVEILSKATFEALQLEGSDGVMARHEERVEGNMARHKARAEQAAEEREKTKAQRKEERKSRKRFGRKKSEAKQDTTSDIDDDTIPVLDEDDVDDSQLSRPQGLGEMISTGSGVPVAAGS